MAINFDSSYLSTSGSCGAVGSSCGSNKIVRQNLPLESLKEEREQKAEKPAQVINADPETLRALDAQRVDPNPTVYDIPNSLSSKAVSLYKDVANAERREEIQSLVGVDLFV